MKQNRKKKRLWMRSAILAVMAIAVIYTLYANFTKDHSKIAIGDLAPDFVLTDMDGNQHKLSDYRGQGVFLNFWGTWCEPCKREMPYMNNQYHVYKDQGIEILAVNVGEPDFLINRFLDQYEVDFPVLKDRSKDVMGVYDVGYLPATILVNPNGEIIQIEVGELTEAKIRAMMESIKPS